MIIVIIYSTPSRSFSDIILTGSIYTPIYFSVNFLPSHRHWTVVRAQDWGVRNLNLTRLEWGIGTLTGWGREFEAEVLSLYSGREVLHMEVFNCKEGDVEASNWSTHYVRFKFWISGSGEVSTRSLVRTSACILSVLDRILRSAMTWDGEQFSNQPYFKTSHWYLISFLRNSRLQNKSLMFM